jgi:uroporphyrinogen-III decarboxylase
MAAEKNSFDLNAYCSGHITGQDGNPGIIAFPRNFVTEAQALGAGTEKTAGGFETARYLFSNPEELLRLPLLDEQLPIARLLEEIEKAPPGKTVLLKANGPYSILAALVPPQLFYRWLAKRKAEVHAALERISVGLAAYILKAASRGAAILSLADPYANPEVLGEKHYGEFAAPYLIKALKEIADGAPELVAHLCPHNSLVLERYGFLRGKNFSISSDAVGEPYIQLLAALAGRKQAALLGHQCIYAAKPQELIFLRSP